MRLFQLNEEYILDTKLRLPDDHDGNLYKVIYIDPSENPWHVRNVPGYCWTSPVDSGTVWSRAAMGRDVPFAAVIKFPLPRSILNYFPSEAARGGGMDYDYNTTIKPGWLANYHESDDSGIADVAVVTIAQDLQLDALYGLSSNAEAVARSDSLVGLEAYNFDGTRGPDDFDLWALDEDHAHKVLSDHFGGIRIEQYDSSLRVWMNDEPWMIFKMYFHRRQ